MVMACLKPTVQPVLAPSQCTDVVATSCDPCVADERPPKPCGAITDSGGTGTTRSRHALGEQPGVVQITYDMFAIPDRLDCYYRGVLVATTGGLVSGPGELQWDYDPQPGDPTWSLVVVSAPTNGTAWSYTLTCPGALR